MSNRNKQKQIWADADFVRKLEEIKAKRFLAGKPINNMGELTRELIQTDSFKNVEDEIINFDPFKPKGSKSNNMRINIKFDGLL